MKKLLLVALLMLALVFTVVACQGNKNPDDTTAGTTAASDVTKAPEQPTQAPEQPTQAPEQPTEAPEQPTEAPEQPTEAPEQPTQAPEQPTEEPPVETEEPKPYKTAEEAGKTNASFDTFYVNNNMYFEQDGGAGDKLTAQDNIVAFKLGEAHDSMMIRGWIGFGQAIESFGYFMDDDTVFILDAANIKETEDGVKAAGGEFAVRFEIPVPLADLSDGNYTVGFVAKLADGTIVLLRECLTVSIEGLPWPEDAGKKNASFDTFYVNNNMYFEQDGGAGDKLAAQDNTIIFAYGDAHESMMLRGWIGFEQAIDTFGYFVDNGEYVFNADYTKPTEDGVKAAGGEFAVRFEIPVPLAELAEGKHTVGFIVKLADGTIVRLRDYLKVVIEGIDAADITNKFTSDVASNEEGTDLKSSDLANYFTVMYGASEPHSVSGGLYAYGGINEMYADVNGAYAYIVKMDESCDTSFAFVRGAHAVHSVDLTANGDGLFIINNYYETDGLGKMGGAGIYASIYSGKLNLMIKYYDDAAKNHIGNKYYSAKVEGNEVTMADNGKTVSILVDGQLIATIALSGETTYEKLDLVQPEVKFAKTAVVTLCDGTTETIENTLVASTYESQIGIALRPGTMKFSSLKVLGFSEVVIPEEFYVNEPKINVALGKPVTSDNVENDVNVPANATDGDESTRYGALPHGVANLIIDLEKAYTLTGMDILFENASCDYTISLSTDGESYTVIYESASHGSKTLPLTLDNVTARYIKFTRTTEDTSSHHWFSIYEAYVYAADAEEPTPAGPVLINMDDERSTVTHISNDELRLIKADNTHDNAFAPGAFAGWDGVVTITEGQYIALCDWGWVGMKAETFKFGYILDNDLSVLYMFDEFTYPTEQGVIDAAATTGATNASRFMGMLNTALLPVGEHNVKFVMQQNGAEYVIIRDYKVVVNAAASEPVVENLVIDMATLGGTGYRAEWGAAGYSAPLQVLGYGVTIDLGEIDLSKYSAVKITYSSDGSDNPTKLNYEASSSLAIGLKNENSSYGQATDDNFNGDIAHTDMVFSNQGWAGGARDAIVDLSGVTYNGHVWVAVHNPAGTEIAISAIEFIA